MTKRSMALMGLGGLLAAATLVLAPEAQANEMSYLQSLNNHGLAVYDTSAAIATGYAICNMLDYANGDVVAAYVFTHTSWSDIPTPAHAGTLVLVSVEELCPRHDHRGGFVA